MLACSLAGALVERGFSVDILTDTPAPLSVRNCRVLSPYMEPPRATLVRRAASRFSEYRWLQNQLLTTSYDIVYAVSAQFFTLSAVHIASRNGIPTAFETSLLGSDDLQSISKQRLGPILRRFFLSADKIVDISPALRQANLAAGVPPDKLEVIPNLVDETKFFPADFRERAELRSSLGIPQDAFLLFSAGAISYRKGHDRLIRGFLSIAKSIPSTVLAVAGPLAKHNGSVDFSNTLRTELANAQLSDRVLWLGQIGNVADWMRAADVFLFASRREGFGTVLIEAMASGTPIVAYELPGITDHVIGGERGALTVTSDRQFCDSVQRLCPPSEVADEARALLRLRFEESFSTDVVMRSYLELFRRLREKG